MIREAFAAGAGPDITLIDWKQVDLFDCECFEVRFEHKDGRRQVARGPMGSKATLENARSAGDLARAFFETCR